VPLITVLDGVALGGVDQDDKMSSGEVHHEEEGETRENS
jgi:hypothetical protein